jgi:hypothetical protein
MCKSQGKLKFSQEIRWPDKRGFALSGDDNANRRGQTHTHRELVRSDLKVKVCCKTSVRTPGIRQ